MARKKKYITKGKPSNMFSIIQKMIDGSNKELGEIVDVASDAVESLSDILPSSSKEMSEAIKANAGLKDALKELMSQLNGTKDERENKTGNSLTVKIDKLKDANKDLAEKVKRNTGRRISGKDISSMIDDYLKYGINEVSSGGSQYNAYTTKQRAIADELFKPDQNGIYHPISEVTQYADSITEINNIYTEIEDKTTKISQELNKSKKIIDEQNKQIANQAKGYYGIYRLASVIVKELGKGVKRWIEIDHAVSKTSRSIGWGEESAKAYRNVVLKSYGDIAAELGMTVKDIMSFQEKYTKNTGRAILLSKEQVRVMSALSKVVGETATNDMVKNMDDMGASSSTASEYLAKGWMRAKNMGLDAQKYSEAFAKNIKYASQYTFKEGVDGVSKMVGLSQTLKANFESLAKSANKFQTIEGSITTSAEIQMLGGSYANNFGNPLENFSSSILDMESHINRIVSAVKDKGVFDEKTGVVKFSPNDQMAMKYYADRIGISQDEIFNISSQYAKRGHIEKQLNKARVELSKEDRELILNRANGYENGKHQITFFVNNDQKTKNVEDLTAQDVEEIRKDAGHSVEDDVRDIRNLLKGYILDAARNSKSLQETLVGLNENYKTDIASLVNQPMSFGKQALKFGSENAPLLTSIAMGATTTLSAYYLKELKTHLIGKEKGTVNGSFINSQFQKLKKGLEITKGTLGSLFAKTKKIPKGKAGAIVAALAAAYGGYKLLSGSDDENKTPNNEPIASAQTQQQSPYKEKPLQTNNNNNNNNNNGNIYNAVGVSPTNNASFAHPLQYVGSQNGNNADSEDSSFGMSTVVPLGMYWGDSYLERSGKKAKITQKIGNIGGDKVKSLSKATGRINSAITKKIGTKVLKGGALSLGSVATDLVNFGGQALGAWEEGGTTDKVLNVGSTALEYASYGALIGSFIPLVGNAIGGIAGAAIGTVKGLYDQFGDSDNNENNATPMQQADEYYATSRFDAYDTNKEVDEAVIGIYKLLDENISSFTYYNNLNLGIPQQSIQYAKVVQQPIVGSETYIRTNVNNSSYNGASNQFPSESNINLNISGVLTLNGNGNSSKLDIASLINNESLKKEITNFVLKELLSRQQLGIGSVNDANNRTQTLQRF